MKTRFLVTSNPKFQRITRPVQRSLTGSNPQIRVKTSTRQLYGDSGIAAKISKKVFESIDDGKDKMRDKTKT